MPFITQDRRKFIKEGTLEAEFFTPGDHCYVYYKEMVDEWKVNPRWATAHALYKVMTAELLKQKRLYGVSDKTCAYELAWQVFFQRYIMPYEMKKMEENGGI